MAPKQQFEKVILVSSAVYYLLTIPHIYRTEDIVVKLMLTVAPLIILFTLPHVRNIITKANITSISIVALILYICWGIYAQVTPTSDFLEFYDSAASYSKNLDSIEIQQSKSPVTVIYYGTIFYLFNQELITIYMASSIIWAIQIYLLYTTLLNYKINIQSAKFAAITYGLIPGKIFFASVLSSESVFMFFLIFCLYQVSRIRIIKPTTLNMILLGISLGVFFYTRQIAVFFILTFFIHILFTNKLRAIQKYIVTLTFLIPLAYQFNLNVKYEERPSILPQSLSEFVLLHGTNFSTKGKWSESELNNVGYYQDIEIARLKAREIAFERITTDPLNFLTFALTDKIGTLWGSDAPSIRWGIVASPKYEELTLISFIAAGFNDSIFLVLKIQILLFLIFALTKYHIILNNNRYMIDLIILISIPFLLISGLHIFVEVQSRYHMPFMLILSICSGLYVFRDKLSKETK